MKIRESIEKKDKKLNIVIMGFGELGQGFYDILKATDVNVYVVSVSGKNEKLYKEHGVTPYNRYEGFPVKYEDIDCVLLCCRTSQLEIIKTLIPEEVLPKVVDKCIAFQNGFDVKEKLLSIFGKSIPRSVAFLSFKRYKGKDLTLEIAKPSPIKGTENGNIKNFVEIVNTYTDKKLSQYLFEGVDSIALQREGDFKAIINSVLNSLSVIYKSNVQDSIKSFKEEFGENAINLWAEEISNIENTRLKNSPFEINTGEVVYRILHTAGKFAKEKPSTYQQYYVNSEQRGKVLSEDDHLLGYLIQRARTHNIAAPISNEIRTRMKKIEQKINKKVA